MAKGSYDVSYKTYFNERLKAVEFRDMTTYPLYVQVTYDRKSLFFKSYYFDLFARPKYAFLRTSLSQVDVLERRVIEFMIGMYADRFTLDEISRRYKLFSRDVLDAFDGSFKTWMAGFLKKEKLPGLAILMEHATEEVAAIQLWDDLKKVLSPDVFSRMEEMAVRAAHPYLAIATYVRNRFPAGPFCMPLHEWADNERRVEIETYLDDNFWRMDFGVTIRMVRDLLYPTGF
jgi:hypothetical protein